MKKLLAAALFVICATPAFADELFPNKIPSPFTPGTELPVASTVGGHALYQGDENWRLIQLTTQQTGTLGDADPITMGTVGLSQSTPLGEWSATMYTTANLNGAGLNQYMTGNPCAGNHLVTVNKSRRQDDDCLTIDAERSRGGSSQVTMLVLRVSHAKSAGRLYRIYLVMNLEPLGFTDTFLADWTPAAVQANPERAAFVQRLQKWAESLQDASERALDFKKPQDAFAGIPSFRTLMPPLAPMAEGSFPREFLSAVAETRSRPGFKAFAYAQVGARQFRWQTRNGMGDQASADEQALESCESGRPKAAPPCKLYDLSAAQPAAPQ